jgi:hypothetical protein
MKTYILFAILLLGGALNAQNALHFDGINDRVNCGNGASLNITNHITLEAWIYANSWKASTFQGCIINKEQNNPDRGYMLRAGNAGRLAFNLGNGVWNERTSAPLMSLNTWHHVAATYDGAKMRMFIDGVRVDSFNVVLTIQNPINNLFIGDWYSGSRNFDGKIDEVRIWNVARTQAEIQATMNTELCVLPPGLIAYYTFDEGVAAGSNSGLTTLPDLSGNGNTGTLSNFALTGTTSNWVTGQTLPGGSTSATLNITVCDEYLSPSGNYLWNASGTYHDTIPNAAGCDSIITVNLTITPVDVSLGMFGITLMANAINAYFQWIDCDNNFAHIPGAVFQQFTPTVNGNYACIVTQYGCSDTTICVPITTVGNSAIDEESILRVHPNPSADGWVHLNHLIPGSKVRILDPAGKVINTLVAGPEGKCKLELPGPGNFFLWTVQGDKVLIRRVISLRR